MICEQFNDWVAEQGGLTAATKVLRGCSGDDQLAYQHLQYWMQNGIPLKRVFMVESATGISRSALRPDYFSESAA